MSAAQALPIRFVLSDVDGTLLRPDHSISPAVAAAVRQLQAQGIGFSLASARPPRAMRGLIEAFGIQSPTAAFSGGTLVDVDGRYLETHPVARQAVDASLALFAEHPVAVWLFADDEWLLLDHEAAYYTVERHALGYDALKVGSFGPYLDRVDKIVATSADFALLARLEQQLQPLLAGQAVAARSQQYYLDVTAARANKGDALASLAGYLQVPMAQTAVLGDGGNDVAMFQRAGLAIAMGQAPLEVREHAHRVTASNVDDGAALAITDMILRYGHPSHG